MLETKVKTGLITDGLYGAVRVYGVVEKVVVVRGILIGDGHDDLLV